MKADLSNISRYFLIAIFGVGILVLVNKGYLEATYELGGRVIQTTTVGLGAIGFAAVICILAYLFWVRSQLSR